MSMMDQQKTYILVKAYQTFYVHDGSMEIIHIGISIAKHFLSIMYQHINIVQQKFYVHAGKNILYIGNNILYRKATKHVTQKRNKTCYVQDVSKEITNHKNKVIRACPKLAETCTEKDRSDTVQKLPYNENSGSKTIVGPKKSLVQKKLWSKKIFWSKKNFGQKIFGQKKFG